MITLKNTFAGIHFIKVSKAIVGTILGVALLSLVVTFCFNFAECNSRNRHHAKPLSEHAAQSNTGLIHGEVEPLTTKTSPEESTEVNDPHDYPVTRIGGFVSVRTRSAQAYDSSNIAAIDGYAFVEIRRQRDNDFEGIDDSGHVAAQELYLATDRSLDDLLLAPNLLCTLLFGCW